MAIAKYHKSRNGNYTLIIILILMNYLVFYAQSTQSTQSLLPVAFSAPNATFSPTNTVQYTTYFYEIGLPQNTLWGVKYGALNSSSITNSINFLVQNGVYNFTINSITIQNSLFTPTPKNGSASAGVNTTVNFVQTSITANSVSNSISNSVSSTNAINLNTTFSENGLPLGINWFVTFANSLKTTITPSNIVFNTTNSVFSFTINSITASNVLYYANQSNGSIAAGIYKLIGFKPQSSNTVGTNTVSTNTVTTNSVTTNSVAANTVTSTSTTTTTILPTNLTSTSNSVNTQNSVPTNSVSPSPAPPANNTFTLNTKTINTIVNVKTLPVSNITISFKTQITKFNLSVSVIQTMNSITNQSLLPNLFKNVPKNNVFQYVQINDTVYGSSASLDPYVRNVTYNFTVPASWVGQQNTGNDDVRLLKYVKSSGTWVELPTTYIRANSTNYFYSAISNSFSTYAISFISGNTLSTSTTPLTLSLATGQATYFFAIATNRTNTNGAGKLAVTNVIIDENKTVGTSTTLSAGVWIGHNTFNTATFKMTTGTKYGVGIVGIGANVIFTANKINGVTSNIVVGAGTNTSAAISFNVVQSNSIVIILGAANGTASFSSNVPANACNVLDSIKAGSTDFANVFAEVCNTMIAAGTYNAVITLAGGTTGPIALESYVFPPYTTTLNDIPGTANILTNGTLQNNGNTITLIGTGAINATYSNSLYGFVKWSADTANSANFIITNSTAQNTFLTVMGNGIVTGNWVLFPNVVMSNPSQTPIGLGSKETYTATVYNGAGPFAVRLVYSQAPSWTLTAQYPISVWGEACVPYGANAFCVGGLSANALGNVANVYYTNTLSSSGIGSWAPTNAYLLAVRNQECVPSNSFIYCIGGLDKASGASTTNTEFTTMSSTGVGVWHASTPLTTATRSFGCAPNNGFVYCVAGLTSSQVNTAEFATINSLGIGSWTITTHYPLAVSFNDCAVNSNNYIYCVGGQLAGSVWTSNVYYATLNSLGIGAWQQANSLPEANPQQMRCLAPGNYLICAGGINGKTNLGYNYTFYAHINSANSLDTWTATSYLTTSMGSSVPSMFTYNGYIYYVGGNFILPSGTQSWNANSVYMSQILADNVIAAPGGSARLSVTPNQTGTYSYEVSATDNGFPHPYIFYSNSNTISVQTPTCTISLSNALVTFGTINPSQNVGTQNVVTDNNIGTNTANIMVFGGNWISTSTADTYYVRNTVWSGVFNQAYANANQLLFSAFDTLLTVLPLTGANTVYFGTGVPAGQTAATYNEVINVENLC